MMKRIAEKLAGIRTDIDALIQFHIRYMATTPATVHSLHSLKMAKSWLGKAFMWLTGNSPSEDRFDNEFVYFESHIDDVTVSIEYIEKSLLKDMEELFDDSFDCKNSGTIYDPCVALTQALIELHNAHINLETEHSRVKNEKSNSIPQQLNNFSLRSLARRRPQSFQKPKPKIVEIDNRN